MPTTLELAGADRPEHVFFKSLLPRLTAHSAESPAPSYESIYGSYLQLQRSISHGGWKLIAYPDAKVLRLYHLADDPDEAVDLASRPEHAERLAELFDRLVGLQRELADGLDLTALRP